MRIRLYLIKLPLRGLLRVYCYWHRSRVKSHHGYIARVALDEGLDRTDGRKLGVGRGGIVRGSINRAWNDGDVEWRIKGVLTTDAKRPYKRWFRWSKWYRRLRDATLRSTICAMACLSSWPGLILLMTRPVNRLTRERHYETRDWNSSSNTNYRLIGSLLRARVTIGLN